MSAHLIPQRADDDCTICAIAMATGLPYERVMTAAEGALGGYRYGGKPGTMSPRGVLLDLGLAAERVICGAHIAIVRKFLWGRRAILSMPSLNGFDGHHDVYWDGRAVHDPSPKTTYPPDALAAVKPLYAVLFDECDASAARADGHYRPGEKDPKATPSQLAGLISDEGGEA